MWSHEDAGDDYEDDGDKEGEHVLVINTITKMSTSSCSTITKMNTKAKMNTMTKTKSQAEDFTDCVLLFCFFAFWGSVVFSRGSKKVLFWRTVQDR